MPLTPNTKGMFNDEAFGRVGGCYLSVFCVLPIAALHSVRHVSNVSKAAPIKAR